MSKSRIVIPRELLLIEIERRCLVSDCNAKTAVGLTKEEARAYCGFKCERCDEWHADGLSERDVPEWWEDLAITDLFAVRNTREPGPEDPGEVVSRMSDGYYATRDVT